MESLRIPCFSDVCLEMGKSMQKNYEELKRYLNKEEGIEKNRLDYNKIALREDENHIMISYPNEDLQKERIIIRQKYRDIQIPNHRHEYIELSFMLEGELDMYIEGKKIKMKSGDLCLMDKNVAHSTEIAGDDVWMFNILMTADFFDTIFMYLFSDDNYISNYIINSLYSESKKKNYIYYHIPEHSFVEQLMEQIICEYFLENPCNKGKMISCLCILFIEISRATEQNDEETIRKNNSKIQKDVVEYLKEHYKDATLQSVAKHMCFHPNYLSALLKMETGRGFKDILLDIRMKEAEKLLRKTDAKIEDIVEQIGYANESYFYKCFRQKYGESPFKYRKNHKELKKEQ